MLRDRSLIPLSQQHHNGLALCVLTERSLRQDPSSANVAVLAGKAIDRYELELTNHFEMEEQVLFPTVEAHLGKLPLIAELIADHRALEGMVEEMRASATSELLLRFTALLRAHIRREEAELFEDIQKRLPRQALDALGESIDAKAIRICL